MFLYKARNGFVKPSIYAMHLLNLRMPYSCGRSVTVCLHSVSDVHVILWMLLC